MRNTLFKSITMGTFTVVLSSTFVTQRGLSAQYAARTDRAFGNGPKTENTC